jgi:hypothetical protein
MNRANAGRPRMAWYCEGQSMTSNSIFSFLKFAGVPKMTSKCINPKRYVGFPGTVPWKEVSVGRRSFIGILIFHSVSA